MRNLNAAARGLKASTNIILCARSPEIWFFISVITWLSRRRDGFVVTFDYTRFSVIYCIPLEECHTHTLYVHLLYFAFPPSPRQIEIVQPRRNCRRTRLAVERAPLINTTFVGDKTTTDNHRHRSSIYLNWYLSNCHAFFKWPVDGHYRRNIRYFFPLTDTRVIWSGCIWWFVTF